MRSISPISAGSADHSSATTPLPNELAIVEPPICAYRPSGIADTIPTPGATTSGLILLPSAVTGRHEHQQHAQARRTLRHGRAFRCLEIAAHAASLP